MTEFMLDPFHAPQDQGDSLSCDGKLEMLLQQATLLREVTDEIDEAI